MEINKRYEHLSDFSTINMLSEQISSAKTYGNKAEKHTYFPMIREKHFPTNHLRCVGPEKFAGATCAFRVLWPD
jgi:hypothetical protein